MFVFINVPRDPGSQDPIFLHVWKQGRLLAHRPARSRPGRATCIVIDKLNRNLSLLNYLLSTEICPVKGHSLLKEMISCQRQLLSVIGYDFQKKQFPFKRNNFLLIKSFVIGQVGINKLFNIVYLHSYTNPFSENFLFLAN